MEGRTSHTLWGMAVLGLLGLGGLPSAFAQQSDPNATALRINEILASNKNTPPADVENEFEDLIEIYNTLEDQFVLLKNVVVANAVTKDEFGKYHPVNGWKFDGGSIMPKAFITIFCDGEVETGSTNQPHTSFKLNAGGELIALFTADDVLIDMVVFPKIPEGISYGRTPDGAGPTLVLGADPSFCYFPTPTFKAGTTCNPGTGGCTSAGNGTCGNVAPEVDFKPLKSIGENAAGANPAPDAPVPIHAEAWDEKVVGGSSLVASVKVVYRVNGGDEAEADLAIDPDATAALVKSDPLGLPGAMIPDPNKSVWKGQILGQAQGSIVTFHLLVTDTEGLSATDSKIICTNSTSPPTPSDCHMTFRYQVGFQTTKKVIVNEICPQNLSIIRDMTDFKFEDYIELYATEETNLTGMCLSTNPFRPWDWALPDSGIWTQHWKFPPGSTIAAEQHLLIWCDNDASRSNPAKDEYHTNFDLATEGDGIFLFDTEDNGFGLIDGYVYGVTAADTAWSRCPDGAAGVAMEAIPLGSPKVVNNCDPSFLRGDPNVDSVIDLSDVIVILEFLFTGGTLPDCLEAANVNDTGTETEMVDISDPIYILQFRFNGGPAPTAPYPDCGKDTNSLGCTVSCPAGR